MLDDKHRQRLESLTPRQIVEELDRYVIGQRDAKRMVAIALRTRWRRQRLPDHLRDEVIPKNIIMIGPTGVGKTEISRPLAKLAPKLLEGKLNTRSVEIEVKDKSTMPIGVISNIGGMEQIQDQLQEMLGGMFPAKKKRRLVKVPEALELLTQEEAQKLIDMEA